MTKPKKSITIPIDGSKNALKAIDYLALMLGPEHDVKIHLCYILPSLPLIFDDEKHMTREERTRKRSIEKKNVETAERIMAEARSILMDKGFSGEHVETLYQEKNMSITRDVCFLANRGRSDVILLTRHGKTEVKNLFMGEVCRKFVEYCQEVPLWIVGGTVHSKKVLVAVDASENSRRAVDHASFMLSGTDCPITVFHTQRHVTRYVPMEMLTAEPTLEKEWREKSGGEIASCMEKYKTMLLEGGIEDHRISIKVADGTRSAANDILAEAKAGDYGTIVMGRRGISRFKELYMGSVTSKVLQQGHGVALWVIQ